MGIIARTRLAITLLCGAAGLLAPSGAAALPPLTTCVLDEQYVLATFSGDFPYAVDAAGRLTLGGFLREAVGAVADTRP